MRILLDTHVLLWYLEGNQALSRQRRHLIIDSRNEILVSIASMWEIAVKISVGRLKIEGSLSDIFYQLSRQSITILGVQSGHILQVASLPLHHRDPFDRMIIAQAQVEYLTLMTHDPAFAGYGVKVLQVP